MNENFREYTIDFFNVKTYFEMHAVIRKSLNFPAYYGCNWDACWDCLTDMAGKPLYIRIFGLEVLQQKKFEDEAKMLTELLEEFKHYENDEYVDTIRIEIINQQTGEVTVLE